MTAATLLHPASAGLEMGKATTADNSLEAQAMKRIQSSASRTCDAFDISDARRGRSDPLTILAQLGDDCFAKTPAKDMT